MPSSNSSIRRAITGLPIGPEEDSFDVDWAARSSALVMGPVTGRIQVRRDCDDINIIINLRLRRLPVENISRMLSKLFFSFVNRTGFGFFQGS